MHGKEIIGSGRKILNAGAAEPGASGARRSGCNHADTAVAIAEYMVREMNNGAGLAQYLDNLRKSKVQHHYPDPWPATADDIQDHLSIKLGTDLYYDVAPHALTVEILLERIVAVPLPWVARGHRAKQRHFCTSHRPGLP